MIRMLMLAMALGAAACGTEARPLLREASPLNGSTAVEVEVRPRLVLADETRLDPAGRRLVLYDVTQGARLTVAGGIEQEGSSLTYLPETALSAGHDYVLVLERAAISGEQLDEIDASEWPEEPLSWPYYLRFSTASRPQVRAAYLQRDGKKFQIVVRFSQQMDPVTTSAELSVLDSLQEPLAADPPLWLDERSAQLTLQVALDPALPYTLRVGGGARSSDNQLLDGDGDGLPGEPDDAFSASFSGSQPIIRSRQQPAGS